MRIAEAAQILAGIGADQLLRADDRLPGRRVAELGPGQQFPAQVLRVVLVHGDLLEHHAALALQLIRGDARVQHQIREQ